MSQITKSMKYELIYLDGAGDFREFQARLWELQKGTREIMNKTILEIYTTEAAGNKFDKTAWNALYRKSCDDHPDIATKSVTAPIRAAQKKYNSSKLDIIRGTMSLPSFKRDQPILLHNESVKLMLSDHEYTVRTTVFSDTCKKAAGINQPRFRVSVNDNTQRSIIDKLISGEYKLGQCQLVYERPKWFIILTYTFENVGKALDEDKILGVDLGCVYAVYASSFGNRGVFKIPGDEISAFERKQAAMQGRKPLSVLDRVEHIEDRHKAKQQQARYCGEGRIGHGTKTRVASVYADSDKIARFRDTINHRYSKALVDYAVKNGYGTIQLEDLSGIKGDNGFPKRLRHWTYYDLRSKIEYKAKERGIKVLAVDPAYTSQRCSRCGCIDADNRPTQDTFRCVSCGFKGNADYNASQNISIKGIDKLIKESKDKNSADIDET